MDMFKTRSLTEAILQLRPASTFMSSFFKRTVTHTTKLIEVDTYKGKRKVAPYSRSSAKSTPLERVPFRNQPMEIPYIKLSRSLEPVQALLRAPGENIYSSRSPLERARELMATDLMEINDAIARAEELQAVQALVTGIVIIKGFEVDMEANFGRSAGNTYAVGTLWTAAGANPGGDLVDANLLIQQSQGLSADIAILGSTALKAFLVNALVLDQLDTTNGAFGAVSNNQQKFPGATYYGMFSGFQIWGYNEWYLDDADGVEKAMIPANAVIVTSSQARNWRHYGPIMDFGSLIAERRFAKSWEEQDPSVRFLSVQSAPLMVPHDVDATVRLTVTA